MSQDAVHGQVAWQERGFAKGQLVKVGEKLFLLDEEGTLALIEATSAGEDLTQIRVILLCP